MPLIYVCLIFLIFPCFDAQALVNAKVKKTDLPAVLKADIVSGDQIKGEIKASGNVEISKDSSVIYANQVVYNRNSKIIAGEGNVRIKNLEVGTVFTPQFQIKDDFSQGDFFDARVFFVDGSYLFSKKMSRLSAEETQLKSLTFSICPNEEIANDNQKAGKIFDFVAIKSSTATIDKADNKLSSWNSMLKIYNVPIFYFPYLKMPLPAKKRSTGFLPPSYVKNSNFGLGIRIPYFIDIAKDKDLTITPIYYLNSDQLIVDNEWRQIVKYGNYKINLELANNKVDNNLDKTIVKRSNKDYRWSFEGAGKLNFTNNLGANFDILTVADRNYLRDYNFNYLAYTTSKVNFDYIKKRDYMGVSAVRFQELENASLEKKSPLILPILNGHFESDPLFFKEKVILSTNFASIRRANGLQYNRGSATPQFKIPFNLKGNLFEFSTKLQGDIYALNDKDLRSNVNDRIYNATQSDLKSEFAFNWRLPMRNKSQKNTLTIEPIINLVSSNYKTRNSLVPLEDSVDAELSFSNLFSNDRISGYDRNEAGRRLSYGFKSSFYNFLGEFDLTAGQALILKKHEQDVKIRGFADNNKSNVVGIASFKGKKYFNFSYAFQLDQANYRNDVNQVISNFEYKKFSIGGDYLLIRRNAYVANKREQASLSSAIMLPNKWRVRIFTTRDFVQKRNIQRGIEIIRSGCCSDFGFSMIERNPSNLTKPQKTFNLNLTFKNL